MQITIYKEGFRGNLVDGIIQGIRDEFVQLNIKLFLIEKVVLFSYRIILNKKGRT